MRIIFFGSSSYCLPILDTLKANFDVVAFITKTHQQKFKDQTIPFKPKDKSELLALKDELISLKPDLAIVADYGLIIPKEIIDLPKHKTINIHFSKLPALRGPSPIQYTILEGNKSAWISIIIMDEGMDTGDIIWQKEVPIDGTETAESLYKKLFNTAAFDLPDVINKYVQNKLTAQKQDHTKATYTKLLTREDGYIPPQLLDSAINGISPSNDQKNRWPLAKYLFSQLPITPSTQLGTSTYQLPILIERAIRALSPWPGVWTEITLKHLGGGKLSLRSSDSPEVEESEQIKIIKRLKILKAHLETTETIQDRKAKPILDRKKLVPNLVQLEGKNPVSWKQFKEGHPNFKLI